MRIDLRAEKSEHWTYTCQCITTTRSCEMCLGSRRKKRCFAVDMRSQFEMYLYLIYWSATNIIIQTSHNGNNNRYCSLALRIWCTYTRKKPPTPHYTHNNTCRERAYMLQLLCHCFVYNAQNDQQIDEMRWNEIRNAQSSTLETNNHTDSVMLVPCLHRRFSGYVYNNLVGILLQFR